MEVNHLIGMLYDVLRSYHKHIIKNSYKQCVHIYYILIEQESY